jgi:hypothetical protein
MSQMLIKTGDRVPDAGSQLNVISITFAVEGIEPRWTAKRREFRQFGGFLGQSGGFSRFPIWECEAGGKITVSRD